MHFGWGKTHFLSFSSELDTARKFAVGDKDVGLTHCDGKQWDTSIITLGTDSVQEIQGIDEGIYICTYLSRQAASCSLSFPEQVMRLFDKASQKRHKVLLIDVATYLQANAPSMRQAIENAMRDKEWLILPTDTPPELNGQFGAKLNDGCIVEFQKFKYAIP
jgi:hypothetical protein